MSDAEIEIMAHEYSFKLFHYVQYECGTQDFQRALAAFGKILFDKIREQKATLKIER